MKRESYPVGWSESLGVSLCALLPAVHAIEQSFSCAAAAVTGAEGLNKMKRGSRPVQVALRSG